MNLWYTAADWSPLYIHTWNNFFLLSLQLAAAIVPTNLNNSSFLKLHYVEGFPIRTK